MGYLKLNRFGDPGAPAFDPKHVIASVQEKFADVNVLPGDQLALVAEKAAAEGAAEHIVRTLRHNQKDYGPAYAFEIRTGSDGIIQGRARRYDVTFLYADPLPAVWHERLLAFLRMLGPGKIEQGAADLARPA